MKKPIFFCLFFSCLLGTALQGQHKNLILSTDFEGEITHGSIEELIRHIQDGQAIRVGWDLDFDKDGVVDITHWIDADFITVMNGHVFNQVEPIYRQIPKQEIPQVEIIASDMKWTAIIGTNGILMHRYVIPGVEDAEDELVRAKLEARAKVQEMKVATYWAIK